MTAGVRPATTAARGTLLAGLALAAVAVAAWVEVVRGASSMVMPGASPSLAEGIRFTVQWGVMMAAMMLPSAMPVILLYRTVRARLAPQGELAVPVALFAGVYLLLWLALGVPLYAAHVAIARALVRWPSAATAAPYAVACVLAAAGAWQLSAAKRACLRHCESPLGFLMRRWRSGYGATLRLAAAHASYCVGCCWGLMLVLVAAGAMSLPWVLAITAVVFAEKVLPGGARTARAIGVLLFVAAAAVAVRPELAGTSTGPAGRGGMPMGHMEAMER